MSGQNMLLLACWLKAVPGNVGARLKDKEGWRWLHFSGENGQTRKYEISSTSSSKRKKAAEGNITNVEGIEQTVAL